MSKNPVLYKTLVVGIILLFIGLVIAPTISSDITTSTLLDNDGSLLGYVNDTSGNPIEGALVRVYFHETYEEDYSDSSGFYHVSNISICWCMKNATCSKEGYKTEWALLSIVENTTYDFVLTEGNNPPSAPEINGPTRGIAGVFYNYKFMSIDPDGDDIFYFITWGEAFPTEAGPFRSGVEITLEYKWFLSGTYWIRAKAIDIYDAESDWAEHEITIPRTRASSYHWLWERFPLLERLLGLL